MMRLGALHLRFTDNHEQTRAVARYGMNGALAAQVLMMTLDGVPMLHNGMEVGDATESGDPALFEKMPIFWNPSGRPPLRAIYHDPSSNFANTIPPSPMEPWTGWIIPPIARSYELRPP